MKRVYIFDIEVYQNLFYAVFKELDGDDIITFDDSQLSDLRIFLKQDLVLVGFNSRHYDDVILHAICDGMGTTSDIYNLSVSIINGSIRESKYKKLPWTTHHWDDIDLKAIGLYGKDWSLKKHEIRLRMNRVEDLPYPFDSTLTEDQKEHVKRYCKDGDIVATELLYHDFNKEGVLETACKIQDIYPFTKSKALYQDSPKVGETIINTLYLRKSGTKHIDKIIKPNKILFDPKELSENITFTNDCNKDAWEYIRSIPAENVHAVVVDVKKKGFANIGVKNWRLKHLKDIRFKTGNVEFTIGVGGLHSSFNQSAVKGNLVDFDVSSYYPSIILNNKKAPVGLSDVWLDIYLNLFNERLKSNKEGDKAASNIFKLILNSVYGKLNSKYSALYDPSLLMMTTLSGQLYLIMLCERFADAGFNIISANTDGITIDVEDRIDEARKIASEWEMLLELNLKETHFSDYVSVAVNDYFAVDTSGSIKRKGLFNTSSGLSPSVIVNAVVEYFVNNTPISEYINKQHSIYDYLQHGQASGKDIKWRDIPLQKNNRWYYSTDGDQITHVPKNSTTGNRSVVPNSSNCRPLNNVESESLPDDLNYNHYITEAQKIINGIENQLPSTHKDTNELLYQKSKLEKCNVFVVPKGTKSNSKANHWGDIPNSPDEIHTNYPWYRYNGIGILTGKIFNTIAIDIDDIEKTKNSGIYKFLQKSTAHLTCWHNVGKRKDVAEGNIKGTILFEYKGDDLFRTNMAFAKENGFEILYGKNVVQALGVHGNGEPYQYGGSLKPIPSKLLNFLNGSLVEYEASSNDGTFEEQDLSCPDELIDRIEKVSWVSEQLGVKLTPFKLNKGIALQGLCPYDHHDDHDESQFTVFLNNDGSLGQNCRHQKCSEKRGEFIKQLRVSVSKMEPVEDCGDDEKTVQEIYQPSVYIEPEYLPDQEDIVSAINLGHTFKTILAPTGGGKTFSISNVVAKRLTSDPDFKAMIIVNTNQQIEQVLGEIQNALDSTSVSRYGILGVCSEELQVNGDKTSQRFFDSTKVIVTNFANVSRRGNDILHHNTTLFADKDTHIFIDEADSFVTNQTIRIPLGWRGVASSTVGNNVVFNYVDSCPGHGDYSACKRCKGFGFKGRTYGVNWRGMVDYRARNEVDMSVTYTDSAFIDFKPYEGKSEMLTGNLEVKFLNDKGTVRYVKTGEMFGSTSASSLGEYFKDVLDNGFRPTVWTDKLNFKGKVITRDEAVKLLEENKDNQYLLNFPQSPCGVHYVTTIDKISINHFSTCKSVTLLTATMTHNAKQFFTHMLKGLKIIEIKASEEQKMDSIKLVGTIKGVKPKNFNNVDYNSKLLRFNPTKLKASSQFKAISNAVKANLALNAHDINDQFHDRTVKQKTISDNVELVITHSLGVIGRGMNMPDFDISVIDARIYKPTIAYQADDLDRIREQQNEDRLVVIIQNAGRILRGGGNKTIFVDRLPTVLDLLTIGESLQSMSLSDVKVELLMGCVKGAELTPVLQHLIDKKEGLCPGTKEYYEDLCINNEGIPFKEIKFPKGMSKKDRDYFKKLYQDNLRDFSSEIDKIKKYKDKYKTVGKVKNNVKYKDWNEFKQKWFDEIFEIL